MTKFKLLFKLRSSYRNSLRCIKLIKRYLMDKSNQNQADNSNGSGTKKKIKVRRAASPSPTRSSDVSDVNDSSSAESFIPLAARDSKWVDLSFYNPNFETQLEDDLDEEEMQIIDVDGIMKPPILMLFPGLSIKDSANLTSNLGSTSDVTKLLVGQKADFSRMKSSRKLFTNDNKLSSVQEIVENESATSSLNSYRLATSYSNKSLSERHESQESITDISKRKVKCKKRKKMPDIKINTIDCGSSVSLIKPLMRRSYRPKQRGNATIVHKDSELKSKESNGSLGDDEHETT